MPKRSNSDKIERYQRKIRKLQHKQRSFKKNVYSSTSESDKSDYQNLNEINNESTGDLNVISNDQSEYKEPVPASEPVLELETVPEMETIAALDPEILSALGEATEETPKFGAKIHENLARLWLPIIKKGLNKETKENLSKLYSIPENCPLLQAPKLNPKIAAAVTEGTRTKDKRVEAVQQQLGLGITALNKGLELLLDKDKNKVEAIKFLSDSCRLLCDLHYVETEARKKFVTPGLDKTFLNIMQDVERDEMLFGNRLSEKIKATKVIEKHGLQIKKPTLNLKSTVAAVTSRPRNQGNWQGPPRPSANRGGRGGQRKAMQPIRRATSGNPAQQRLPVQQKPRVTNHQQ